MASACARSLIFLFDKAVIVDSVSKVKGWLCKYVSGLGLISTSVVTLVDIAIKDKDTKLFRRQQNSDLGW